MKVVCLELQKDQKREIKKALDKANYIRLHSDEHGNFYISATQNVYVKEKKGTIDIKYTFKLKNWAVGPQRWIAHLHYGKAKLFTLLFSKTKRQNGKENLKIKYYSNSCPQLEVRSKKPHEQYGRFYYQLDTLNINGYSFSQVVSVDEHIPEIRECDYKSADHYYDWSNQNEDS